MSRRGKGAQNRRRLPLLLLFLRLRALQVCLQAARGEAEGKKRKMSSSMADPPGVTAAVVTVSDSCARGERKDLSGPAVAQFLQQLHFSVTVQQVVPDDSIQIQNLLIRLAPEVRFVVTTGGTGIAPR